ncbi:MAG: DUF4011 domain-containing protein [Acholeplasmatales bacterium]|jgi:DNA polymerase III delta prime subunit|nr:DUF4011 domain-containing protein [Acholeplasmatales bacterium]
MNNNKTKQIVDGLRNKLVDTGLKNQLINFRFRKSSNIEIIHPYFDDLLFSFNNQKELVIANLFDNDEEIDPYDFLIEDERFSFLTEDTTNKQFSKSGSEILTKKDIYTYNELSSAILNYTKKASSKYNYVFVSSHTKIAKAALNNILKKSKLFLEENAINILYLSLGNLVWKTLSDPLNTISSPLLLLSVELKQESIDSLYKLDFSNSELLLNDTLIKKMKDEYNIDLFYEFYTKESYINIYKEYSKLVLELTSNKNFYIEDRVFFGLFSFSKITMVNDLLENEESVLNNKFVRLLGGDISMFVSNGKLYQEKDIDSVFKYKEFYHTLTSDPSQEAAIQSAISGHSFILQGPPGTGKSQTITNIISELISRGKKVLFVAEKKAALDVVLNNLKRCGFESLVLSLHSTDIDKKEIIKDLNNCLISRDSYNEVDNSYLDQKIEQINNLLENLKSYENIITSKIEPLKLTVYEMLGTYYSLNEITEKQFVINDFLKINNSDLTNLSNIINEFENATKKIGNDVKNNIWYGLKINKLFLREQDTLENTLKEQITNINALLNIINNFLFTPNDTICINDIVNIRSLFNHLSLYKGIDSTIIKTASIDEDIEMLNQIIILRDTISSNTANINKYYDEIISEKIDIDLAYRIYKRTDNILKRIFSKEYKNLKKQILLYSKQKRNYKETLYGLELINTTIKLNKNYQTLFDSLTSKNYNLKNNDFEAIVYNLNWYKKYLFFKKDLNGKINITKNEDSFNKMLADTFKCSSIYNNLNAILDKMYSLDNVLYFYFDKDTIKLQEIYLENVVSKYTKMINNIESIYLYVNYNKALDNLKINNLTPFYNAIIESKITSNFFLFFQKRLYHLILDNYFNTYGFQDIFSKDKYSNIRKNFSALDDLFKEIAKINVLALGAKRTPNYNGLDGLNYDILTLRKEAEKVRKIKPLRVLFKEIYGLILDLKPCLMMSPLSVSNYLKDIKDFSLFDCVIFDEASQIRPENSLGTIARASQIIIVGDKEQLPPTNFFESIENNESAYYDELDDSSSYDSILEYYGGLLDTITLKWHYRSKFDDLIKPSNEMIYKNLITFPSSNTPTKLEGIDFEYVKGIYKDRQNQIEAAKVVEIVKKHFDLYKGSRSLGIVTFSEIQSTLIEKYINNFRRKNVEYEKYFKSDIDEYFFIKNIETVQGDERDTIVISVCYGPDEKGKISHNFGPLNKKGGYRRLNVAITRAKYNLILVSSLLSNDIDLSKSESKGVEFFKKYLEYAQNSDLEDTVFNFEISREDLLVDDLCAEIENRGYNTSKNIGTSSFKVDVAVINLKERNKYLLGILFDYNLYNKSSTVLDKEKLKIEMLKSRGWNLYSLNISDYYYNKSKVIDEIINQINNSQKEVTLNKKDIVPVNNVQKKSDSLEIPVYPSYKTLLDSYTFLGNESKTITKIIEILSPVHISELKKILPQIYAREKYSSFVENSFEIVKQELLDKNIIYVDYNDFYIFTNSKIIFRQTTLSSNKRTFEHIHDREILDCIVKLLSVTKKMKLENLYKILLNYTLYQVSTENIINKINDIIRLYLNEYVIIENDTIILKERNK